MSTIAAIRSNYSQQSLTETDAEKDAIKQFEKWWNEAIASEITEVNAMTLATADADGTPAARIVLLKDFSEKGFTFFTNYESSKGEQLAQNPKACLVFFWKELERQVRITGTVSKVLKEESETYFFSRPQGSQIGAITSPQSKVIASRQVLDEKNQQLVNAVNAGAQIKMPDYWGGYIVAPQIIEFWQGRPNRLHDRLQYTLQQQQWKLERLAP